MLPGRENDPVLRRLQHLGLRPTDRSAAAAAVRAVAAVAGGAAPSSAPAALLVCPPPVGRLDRFAEEFAGAAERSRDLARHYAAVAAARSCAFVDAGAHVRSSDTDGIHLDAPAHQRLGAVLARQVRELLA
jgi:lysophospholipase L1-like esterase